MKNPKFSKYLTLAITALVGMSMFSGCAMMFSSRYQKVEITSATKGAKVEYPEVGTKNKNGATKFDKTRIYHTVTVKKEGYKSANYAFGLSKTSPTLAFMAIDFVIPIIGWFYGIPWDLSSPKIRKFDKSQVAPALIPYDKRKEDEKYIIINTTAIDAKGKDIILHQYKSLGKYKAGKHNDTRSIRKLNKSQDKEDLKVDNTIFTSALNGTMKKMNFIDTTNTIFPAVGNTLYLNATIKEIVIQDVESPYHHPGSGPNSMYVHNRLLSIQMVIEWEVLDYYKQEIYSTKTTEKSDLFSYSNYSNDPKVFSNFLISSMEDNLEYAIIKIRKELTIKGLLQKTSGGKAVEMPAITINKPGKLENGRLNDYMKSAVTIKVDEGHGSGAIISDDGYIITAYHVVAGSKKIEIIMGDGTKDTVVQVVRKNEDADLALLKIGKTGLPALAITNATEPEIGVDVWAIGTPKSVELGQSVSKGVLSGLRKANNVTYLQTDVSLNGGNSGGPLVNKEGTILGVVTSKLVGVGTEGVGFAISAQEIMNKLKVQYKN